MSLFANKAFSAAGYAASRPSYPASLFKTVLNYHNAQNSNGTLLDLGCGHGLISRALSPKFGKTIATDPSLGMVTQAKSMTTDSKIEIRKAQAEDLSFLSDESVDLVVSGQAAHWFDYDKAWPEIARVTKPGGSMAFWGYKDNVLLGHRKANVIFDKFSYGEQDVAPGIESMAPHWEQPGRSMVRRLLADVVPPAEQWEKVQRILYDVDAEATEVDIADALMVQETTLGGFESYVRTASSYIGWKEAHPERRSRADGGEGDIVDMLMDEIVASEPAWKEMGENWRDAKVKTVWGSYIVMAKRR
ncbi:S-adenosylmethionine-dependent methyltransferase, putative [Cordyceps militaris CM01]|uniref:S-adenosylmethionine-dependent methyltransferase, putative n=1 Tax=Cordyceps militaris (strain CM01) TaxID=983644 RepID=G3J6U2_CORMM|nr:S-adenosylmethionine-dependent methyltransferase, putative [Cordyceps militaris CM01]EGX96219.1 S-adenosylmethionine-dependent methyltransferase, putative [Cordyceps militaris CM01]